MIHRFANTHPHGVALWLILTACLLVASACASTSSVVTGGTPTTSTAPSATATASAAATATSGAGNGTSIPVQVYFSRHPDSDNDVTAVFAVNRMSPTPGVGTFAIQQLIAGPTAAEAAAGYFTELTASLTGASNCGGPDFQYTIDNGTHTGTLKFCRMTSVAGDLTGARIQAEISKTLTQFPNVAKVIILNSSGHCFNDLSGGDMCLR